MTLPNLRIMEFFEDSDGRRSTNRLCQLIAVMVLSASLIMAMRMATPDAIIVNGLAGILATAAGTAYGISKWRDTQIPKGKINADNFKPTRESKAD